MFSFLKCTVLCSMLCLKVFAFDFRFYNDSNMSVCVCDTRGVRVGSGVLVTNSEMKNINYGFCTVLSCQHMLTYRTYDNFGDRMAFSTSSCLGCSFSDKIFERPYYTGARLYKKLVFDFVECNGMTVNITNLDEYIDMLNVVCFTRYEACHVNRQYLTFCEPNIELPIDISVLFVKNIDTSFAKICDLPTNDQISSWKNKTIKVTIYGYPASKNSEHSVTCDMRLTNCGNWFKSLKPIPQGFVDLHGMSGGPGFTEEEVLCGVMSGCDNDRRLCVRALTTDLVEAIKFGVEKMLDK